MVSGWVLASWKDFEWLHPVKCKLLVAVKMFFAHATINSGWLWAVFIILLLTELSVTGSTSVFLVFHQGRMISLASYRPGSHTWILRRGSCINIKERRSSFVLNSLKKKKRHRLLLRPSSFSARSSSSLYFWSSMYSWKRKDKKSLMETSKTQKYHVFSNIISSLHQWETREVHCVSSSDWDHHQCSVSSL